MQKHLLRNSSLALGSDCFGRIPVGTKPGCGCSDRTVERGFDAEGKLQLPDPEVFARGFLWVPR